MIKNVVIHVVAIYHAAQILFTVHRTDTVHVHLKGGGHGKIYSEFIV